MSETAKNPSPFDLLVEQIRDVVRQELKNASNGHTALLTAEELAQALKVNKATVYEWVKSKAIPYYQAGRFVRFDLNEVLKSQRNGVNSTP